MTFPPLDPLDLTLPAGVTTLAAPALLPMGTQLRGKGMGRSVLQKSYGYGPMLCALSPSVTDTGPQGAGPIGDASGFVLNNRCKGTVDFAECPWLWYYPLDGSWWFEVEFRYDGGSGFVWGLGGALLSTDVKVQASLAVSGGNIIAYTNDTKAGATGPTVAAGQWYTCRVTVNPDGSGTLTVNGTDYPLAGELRPITIRWHDSLILGGVPGYWPAVLSSVPVPDGRLRNCRIGSRFAAPVFPLLSGNTPFQAVPGDGPGYLFIRPDVDLGGMGGVGLFDLTLDGNATMGVGLFVDNCQEFAFERVKVHGISHAALFQRNVYSGHVHGCHWYGDHTAYTARHNAHQFKATSGTYWSPHYGIVLENSFGASIDDARIFGQGPGGIPVVVSGQGTPATLTDVRMYDEGVPAPGPRSLALFRNAQATVDKPLWSRGLAGPGTLCLIDGGGPVTFHGGSLNGAAGSPVFEVVHPPTSPCERYGTTRGAAEWFAETDSFGAGF